MQGKSYVQQSGCADSGGTVSAHLCPTKPTKAKNTLYTRETVSHFEMMNKEEQDIYTLLHCLFEEFTSNGGHFASSDTHIMFTQRFTDWGESPQDAFKRLIRKKATKDT